MRNAFHKYFRPTDEELHALWTHGILAFDASALLNVYGYSKETRDELVSLIEKYSERVQLPHQFALEYSRKRCVVVINQVNNYIKVEKSLKKIQTEDLAPKREHPFLTKNSLDAYETILTELLESKKEMEGLIGCDPYAERLLKVFEGKVSAPPTSADLTRLHTEADERFKNNQPPGFADLKQKGVPDAYGDYVGWSQLMSIAKTANKGVILVIDDFKSDWWRIENERTIGPHPDLVEEFFLFSGQKFFMYTSENFLRAAKKMLAEEINDEVIDEVQQRIASQRITQKENAPDSGASELKGTHQVNDKMSITDHAHSSENKQDFAAAGLAPEQLEKSSAPVDETQKEDPKWP